jgi:hypothetical protein
VTIIVRVPDCAVLTVNPGAGTAESKQTADCPKRIVAWPPTDCTVCAPTPPTQPLLSADDAEGAPTEAVEPAEVVVAVVLGGRDDGDLVPELGEALAFVLGIGVAGAEEVAAGDAVKYVETAWATGGSGVVESKTKPTDR